MDSIQKVCVFGVGGVGGVLGGKIGAAFAKDSGQKRELYFVARGEHLRRIQENGLTITTDQPLICRPTAAVSDFRELPQVDLIWITVKGYDLAEATAQIASHIKEDTIVIPLLNGVDVYQRIRNILQKGFVLPGCIYISAFIEKPGAVRQLSSINRLVLGKDPQYPLMKEKIVRDFLTGAGIDYQWTENPMAAIWEKYALIASCALVTACYRKTYGEVMADPLLREQLGEVIMEIRALAEAEGIYLPDNLVADIHYKVAGLPMEAKTSYQRDIEEKGHRNEGDLFGGTIIRLGKKHGIAVPVTKQLYERIEKARPREL